MSSAYQKYFMIVHSSPVTFFFPYRFSFVEACLREFDNKDMTNSIDDHEMKSSTEDIKYKQFGGALEQQIVSMNDEFQNRGFMPFIRIEKSIPFETNEMFMYLRYINATAINGDLKPSNILNDLLYAHGVCPINHRRFLKCVNKEEHIDTIIQGYESEPCLPYVTSQLIYNSIISSNNLNKHKENMPKSYPKFQHKRVEIAQHVSFVVAMSIIFGGLLFDTWIQPSLTKAQHVSVWASLIGLFGFMVFVWAVVIMILVGAPFVRIQSLVLIFWAIWMHLKS